MKKKIILAAFIFIFSIANTVFAANYTYQKAAVKFNTREAYNEYAEQVNDAVYKTMPRSFSYINREPQFAISINKDGNVEKAWILVSSGSKGYDKKVIKRMENVESLPSYTSRPIRPGDVNGETYCFVTKEEFENRIADGEFYEYDVHHNHYYGTSKKLMNDKISSGKIIVKDIEVNGTESLKEILEKDTKIVTIF